MTESLACSCIKRRRELLLVLWVSLREQAARKQVVTGEKVEIPKHLQGSAAGYGPLRTLLGYLIPPHSLGPLGSPRYASCGGRSS